MAVAFVQQATASSGASSTSLTLTLASAPAAGNLLVMAMAGDKDTGALTLAGFTVAHQLQFSAVTLYVAWKVSDGTETSISPSWATSSVAGNMAWYGEYSDTAVTGSTTWEVIGSAGSAATSANVTTKSSGATGTLPFNGFAVGTAAVDSNTSVTSVSAWGASYSTRYSSTGGSGRGAVFVAELAVSSGTTTTATFNYSGTADNTAAAVTVFRKYASGTTPVTSTNAQSWNVRTPVAAATKAVTWNVRAAVTATSAQSWGVRAQVTASNAQTWNVAGNVTTTVYSFEGAGAADNTDATQTSAAVDLLLKGTGATVKHQAASAVLGSYGLEIASATTGPSYVEVSSFDHTDQLVVWFPYKLPTASLTNTPTILQLFGGSAGTTTILRLQMTTADVAQLQDVASAHTLTGPDLTAYLGQWVVFAIVLSVGTSSTTGAVALRVYDGTARSAGDFIGSEVSTTAYNFGGSGTAYPVVKARVGVNNTQSASRTISFDALKVVSGSQAWVDGIPAPLASPATVAESWNVRSAVTSTKALTWNVRASITQTSAQTWNVRTPVTATKAQSWNVRTPVTATSAQSWGVAAPTTPVTSTSAQSWNVRTAVTASTAQAWNVRTAATSTSAQSWNVRTPVATATKAVSWNVRTSVTQSNDQSWNTKAAATSTSSQTWNTRAQVTSTRLSSWNVRTPMTSTNVQAWSVRTPVTLTTAQTWGVRAQVTATSAQTWGVDGFLQATQTSAQTWNVRTSVTSSKALTWNVRAAVTQTSAQTWNARARATQTSAQSWNVRAQVTSTSAQTWNARARATQTSAQTWNVRARVTQTSAQTWNVAPGAGSSVVLANVVGLKGTTATASSVVIAGVVGIDRGGSYDVSLVAPTLVDAFGLVRIDVIVTGGSAASFTWEQLGGPTVVALRADNILLYEAPADIDRIVMPWRVTVDGVITAEVTVTVHKAVDFIATDDLTWAPYAVYELVETDV